MGTINPNQSLLQGAHQTASDKTPAPLSPSSSQVTFDFVKVQPPSILYVDVDDQLVISAASSQASEVVTVNVRLLLPNGRIEDMQFSIRPLSGRQVHPQRFRRCCRGHHARRDVPKNCDAAQRLRVRESRANYVRGLRHHAGDLRIPERQSLIVNGRAWTALRSESSQPCRWCGLHCLCTCERTLESSLALGATEHVRSGRKQASCNRCS